MKKLYLGLLSVIIVLVIIAFFLLSKPVNEIISNNADQGAMETDSEEQEQTTNSAQTMNSTETATSEGGGGSEDIGYSSNVTKEKVNYTLNIESLPEGLQVLANSSMNNNYSTYQNNTPYSVEVESDTVACVLLTTSIKSGSVVWWEIDGEDCPASLCAGFTGCSMYMDRSHSVVVYYTTPG